MVGVFFLATPADNAMRGVRLRVECILDHWRLELVLVSRCERWQCFGVFLHCTENHLAIVQIEKKGFLRIRARSGVWLDRNCCGTHLEGMVLLLNE